MKFRIIAIDGEGTAEEFQAAILLAIGRSGGSLQGIEAEEEKPALVTEEKPNKPKKVKRSYRKAPRFLAKGKEASSDPEDGKKKTRLRTSEVEYKVINSVNGGCRKISEIAKDTEINWTSVANCVSRLISRGRLIDAEEGLSVA